MTRQRDTSPDPTTAYAARVVKGRIVAGPHVRGACRRHLEDLKHGRDRGFFFDRDLAWRAIAYFRDVLRLNGGQWEGQAYELLDWQAFIVGSLFGWVNAEGLRRYRVAYIETAKGSGKSPLAAGIGIYGLTADNEPRAEIYSAATKKDQAMVLFRDAVAMVDQSPALASRIVKSGIGEKTWNLAYPGAGSFFRPISADDGQSGPRPHIGLIDEVHEHKTNYVVEMLRAGLKWRRQALIFMITNSGTNESVVCRQYHDYGAAVCAGVLEDDSFFAYICALDEDDDPFESEACWEKVNPSLRYGLPGMQYIREQVREARGMPSKEATVRRLNFCQWVESANPWLSREAWLPAGADYRPEDLRGRRCYGGLDLSSTTDLTSLVLAFPPEKSGEKWRLLTWFWMPEEGLAKRAKEDRVPYDVWKKQGYLETTPGKAIKKLHVLKRALQIVEPFDCRCIAYDRWRIEDLVALAEDEGLTLPPLEEFGQGYKDMAPAVSEFERLLIDGELQHPNNPVMTWCAANAVVDEDPAGNKKVTKERSTGRVDGIVAGVMAIGQAIVHGGEAPSVYEQRGVIVI